MVFGCGVDIEEINRFTKHLHQENDFPSFLSDVFTERELEINRNSQQELRFSLGFSCKEAVFKAFGKSWTNSPLTWKDIELIFHGQDLNRYDIQLKGFARELFEKEKIKQIDSYLEFNETYVMFQVIFIN